MPFTFDVKVTPSAGRVAWMLDASGILKCHLKSPPEKGKANKELIKLLAKALKMPAHHIEITSGLTSRKKRVTIMKEMTFQDVLMALGIEQQRSLFS